MKKLLFLITLFFTAAASAQVIKPDLTRSPNGPNTIVDWNVKFKTMIIPHGNTFTLAGAQDSTGHLRLRVAGDTTVAVYIKGFGWLPFANKRDINSATAFGYGLTVTGHTLKVDSSVIQTILNFYPKGDLRYGRLAGNNTWTNVNSFTNINNSFKGSFKTKSSAGDSLTIAGATISDVTGTAITLGSGVSVTGNFFVNPSSGTDIFTVNENGANIVNGAFYSANPGFTTVGALFKDKLQFNNSGFNLTLTPPTLTGNRAITFPNASGTLALTSDIPSGGTYINNSGVLQTGALFNVPQAIITGSTPATVATGAGTPAINPLVITWGAGGDTNGVGATAGAGTNSLYTSGFGGNAPSGLGGAGGTFEFDGGDGGSGSTAGGSGGNFIGRGGNGGSGTGNKGGYASLKGGFAFPSGNGKGGNVYISPGAGNGTGVAGATYLNSSPSGTIRGNVVIGSALDDLLHTFQVTGSGVFTDTLLAKKQYITGTAGQGFGDYISQSARPTGVSGHMKIFRDSVGRFAYMNGIYRRTFIVPRTIDQNITYPYRFNPTLADSSDVAAAYAPIASSANYIQNGTSLQASSNFNISGSGTFGGNILTTNDYSTTSFVIGLAASTNNSTGSTEIRGNLNGATDGSGGAFIQFYPDQGAGANNGGRLNITAFGQGTGANGNAIRFMNRRSTNTPGEVARISTEGYLGVGVTAPSALVHIAASTTVRSSLHMNAGADPTTPITGDIWWKTAGLFYYDGNTQQVAKLNSPTFTGTPTLPTGTIATTQAVGNSTTAVATTAFVQAALATYGSITLIAGVGTATVTGVSATSKATTGFVSVGGTVTTTWQYKVVCTTNTVTITAITNTGTTDTTDTSTLNYAVKL